MTMPLAMTKLELVFIPSPGIGHLVSTIELAKRLLNRDKSLSITLLVILPPFAPSNDTQSPPFSTPDARIRCIHVPPIDPPSSVTSPENFLSVFIESHKPHIEHAIRTELLEDDSVKLIGLVVDLFCSSMIDVAQKIGIPSYLFFTSGAGFLGLMLYLPYRHDQFGAEFDPLYSNSVFPSYVNPVPTNLMPSFVFNKDGYTSFLKHSMRFNETNGIIINTFSELEVHAINSIKTLPPVYAVGPLLDLKGGGKHSLGTEAMSDEIMTWLEDQPPSSVVFLCFGSVGSFDGPQLEQIAMALEASEKRFLWSIRRPPPKDKFVMPSEYTNIQEVLPNGFLARTKERGKVCGWVPQVEVLAHRSIGGFVSHCGWNSVSESLWYGVPIATWPLYAEQQINAFQLVRELGLAVELRLDTRLYSEELVMAGEIKRGIELLMDDENLVRKRVKEVSEKSRKAVREGGSSYAALGRLVEDMLGEKEQMII